MTKQTKNTLKKKAGENKYPYVSVLWEDHYAMYGEFSLKDVRKQLKKTIIRTSSGYKVGETDHIMAIANTIDLDGERSFTDIFYCYKSLIIEVKEK